MTSIQDDPNMITLTFYLFGIKSDTNFESIPSEVKNIIPTSYMLIGTDILARWSTSAIWSCHAQTRSPANFEQFEGFLHKKIILQAIEQDNQPRLDSYVV